MIRSDPEKTKDRVRKLEEYVREHLISARREFICSDHQACQQSRSAFPFHAGQMSHVGRHYDLEVDGRSMRIERYWAKNTDRPASALTLRSDRR